MASSLRLSMQSIPSCAPLVANLFLFCYEREYMMSLSVDKHADLMLLVCLTLHPDIWTIF